MREKYESLALTDLKAIAKARGIKGTSAMKKADVVEAMLREDGKMDNSPAAEKNESVTNQVENNQNNQNNQNSQNSQNSPNGPNKKKEPDTKKISKSRNTAVGKHIEAVRNKSEKEINQNVSTENTPVSDTRPSNTKPENTRPDNTKPDNTKPDNTRSDNTRPDNTRPEVSRNGNGNTRSENTRSENTREGRSEDERFPADLDSGVMAHGILEVMPDGYGFIRCENYMPGENDVYVAPSQIRRFNLKTGDVLDGNTRVKTQSEKFSALLYVKSINGYPPDIASRRRNFEDMTPIFPDKRLRLEMPGCSVAMRIMDLMSPVGKGQRGMIVSPPKAGKTTLLKEVAKSIKANSPDIHLIILLIDERPEEVTDIKEAIEGPNVEVIYSTFDELPDHHKRVSEMVIERAKRLVEHKKDVMILLDSITRLTRAYNLTVPPSGRTLSGGLDPAALHMPKRFFGAARNIREGGSLTILATALVETGSKMDDVVYEEFKGTGNMEMVLDRKLSERRVFPAIDIPKSGTRREDLLLTQEEMEAIGMMRKAFNSMKQDDAVDKVVDMFAKTRNNAEFVQMMKKVKLF